jgi:adenine phosphoribosyltransferase
MEGIPVDKKFAVSLRDVKDFPKPGIIFKDISPLLADPVQMKALIMGLASDWKGKVDVICGFDARGFIFGSLLAYELSIPFVMLRKKGKLPGKTVSVSYGLEYGSSELELQDDAIKKGDKVLLVDDLLATGGTAEAGCRLVEMFGGEVKGIQFIIELSELKGKDKLSAYPVHSVVSF